MAKPRTTTPDLIAPDHLSRIFGSAINEKHGRPLVAADAAAETMLCRTGINGLLDVGNESSDHYRVFEDVARLDHNASMEDAAKALESSDRRLRGVKRAGSFPSDAACDRWTPVVDAAYQVGLATGLRLRDRGQARAAGMAIADELKWLRGGVLGAHATLTAVDFGNPENAARVDWAALAFLFDQMQATCLTGALAKVLEQMEQEVA